MATISLNIPARIDAVRSARNTKHLLSLLLVCGLCTAAGAAPTPSPEIAAVSEREHTPKPEADGLRLEVIAELEDMMTSDGKDWQWGGASLHVDLTLLNISGIPITVPTTAYDEKPSIMPWGPGRERILILIESVKFQGGPIVFVPARYSPVVLAPGERVLLLRHRTWVKDRQQADTTKEIDAVFGVSRNFAGPKDWWRGNLRTSVEIKRRIDPDKYIAEAKANEEKYNAQKAAEQDPAYGKANAARVAALIARADEARIRGEIEKDTAEVTVRDMAWIKQVSAAVGATSLPRSVHCFCIGWRTVNFYQEGRKVVSVAAIHGNQLRINWPGGGGDYPISETDWKRVNAALEFPQHSSQ